STPSRDGPSSTPAIISLTTGGCPTHLATTATPRHAPRITAYCRKKSMESWKLVIGVKVPENTLAPHGTRDPHRYAPALPVASRGGRPWARARPAHARGVAGHGPVSGGRGGAPHRRRGTLRHQYRVRVALAPADRGRGPGSAPEKPGAVARRGSRAGSARGCGAGDDALAGGVAGAGEVGCSRGGWRAARRPAQRGGHAGGTGDPRGGRMR